MSTPIDTSAIREKIKDRYLQNKFDEALAGLTALQVAYQNGERKSYAPLFQRHQTDLMVTLTRASEHLVPKSADDKRHEQIAAEIVDEFKAKAGYQEPSTYPSIP